MYVRILCTTYSAGYLTHLMRCDKCAYFEVCVSVSSSSSSLACGFVPDKTHARAWFRCASYVLYVKGFLVRVVRQPCPDCRADIDRVSVVEFRRQRVRNVGVR